LLIISDPLIEGSVQLNFLENVIRKLVDRFSIDIYSSYIDSNSRKALKGVNIVGKQRLFTIYRIYRKLFGNNEGVLWALSWSMEFLFRRNSGDVKKNVKREIYDSVLNIAQTIPAEANIYWGQSVPLDQTLTGMRSSTPVLKLIPSLIIRQIGRIDKKFIRRVAQNGKIVVTNSFYTKTIYENLGVKVQGVIYSAPDLFTFRPAAINSKNKYVLAYIGKETEIDTIIEIAKLGVKIVTFGAKIPTGSQIGQLRTLTDFKGYVSREELIRLYSNAIFTLFPFTHEPFGYVPLESISCGTPVLTYSKQGPAETVIEGVSGWLAKDKRDLVKKAYLIWNSGMKMEVNEDIQNAARNFSKFGSYPEISMLLSP